MAQSTQREVSDGTLALLDISINYLDRSEITVFFNAVPTVAWSWVGVSEKRIAFAPPVPDTVEVLVKRTTDITKIRHSFTGGAAFTPTTLDEDLQQVLHIAQEASETNLSGEFYSDINMHGYLVRNIGVATDDQDALTLGQYKADALGANAAKDTAVAAAASATANAATVAADKVIVIAAKDTTVAAAAIVGTGVADAAALAAAAAASEANAAASASEALEDRLLAEAAKNATTTGTKADLGLGNVDNTSDTDKPVSTATSDALALKAPLASPVLTGTPTAPTPVVGTNTTQVATTAAVRAEIASQTIGVGQTRQNFTSSGRTLNTDYLNNTGKPIFINVTIEVFSGGNTAVVVIGGQTVATGAIVSSAGFWASVATIILPGETYRVRDTSATQGNKLHWWEIR